MSHVDGTLVSVERFEQGEERSVIHTGLLLLDRLRCQPPISLSDFVAYRLDTLTPLPITGVVMSSLHPKILAATATFEAHGLTAGSAELLANLVWDAPNWNGSPMLDLGRAEKGHLTDLKKNGLVSTMYDSDTLVTFAFFTDEGKALFKTSALSDFIS